MKKSDLIKQLRELNKELTLKESEEFVNLFFREISEALLQGHRVELRGFGNFGMRYKRARQARNPKTGEQVAIPERRNCYFKGSEKLLGAMNRKQD